MNYSEKKFELAQQVETERRRREIQLLINIAEPDPKIQPLLITDEASLSDAVGVDEAEIKRRLDAYFGTSLAIPLGIPLWKFVDAVKALRPSWPDE